MNSRALLRRDVRMAGEGPDGALGVAASGQGADPAVDLVVEHVAADLTGDVAFAGNGAVAVREALRLVVVLAVFAVQRGRWRLERLRMRRQGADGVTGRPQTLPRGLEVELDGRHCLSLRNQGVEEAVLLLIEFCSRRACKLSGLPARLPTRLPGRGFGRYCPGGCCPGQR
ncbi:hypothetical protein KY499_12105 [Arthrobacter sp. PAMC25284]|nr:hypothetical protein KY499_12105 [Arthrobacter sp. PAMC25284]